MVSVLVAFFLLIFLDVSYVSGILLEMDDTKYENLNLEKITAGRPAYSDWITINTDSKENIEMFMSGTDFYDTTGSGAVCPLTNHFDPSYIAYYAEIWNYSTLDDSRSDAEGYITLSKDESPVIQGLTKNILSSEEDMLLRLRIITPAACIGEFDTGWVIIRGTGSTNQTLLYLNPSLVIEPELDMKLISDIAFIDDWIEGDGGIIEGNRTIMLYDSSYGYYPRTYLFEGEKIVFDVQVDYFIEKLDLVFVSIGDTISFGNNLKAECILTNKINATTGNYHCDFTTEIPEEMQGEYVVEVEVLTLNGNSKFIYLGNFFFNPDTDIISSEPLIEFSQDYLGQKVYSKEIDPDIEITIIPEFEGIIGILTLIMALTVFFLIRK